MTKELLAEIADAQMVLVGIGKEMEETYKEMENDSFYSSLMAQAEKEEDAAAILQYLQCYYREKNPDSGKIDAYNRLADLLEGKNYFVVSLCTDDYIYSSKLDVGRIVTPCGGFRALQCHSECSTDQEPLVWDKQVTAQVMEEIRQCEGQLSKVDFPVCAECCSIMYFNRIDTPGYKEEGYLPQWEKYTKWLQGTLNRKLCILELGAGMEYPTVIRFPFEKVAYFNQKARFYRVHSRLYQMTAELKERGVSIQANPEEFLKN